MLTKDEADALQVLRAHVQKHNIGYSVRGGPRRDPHGEPEGSVKRPDQLLVSAATSVLVKDMADLLTKKMPGFRWAIQPNEFGKVFNVFCLDFHGQWGYVIRYDDIMNDPQRREAIKAGRTILARFGYEGTRYDPAKMAAIPRDRQGQAIPITAGLKQDRFTKRATIERAVATGQARVVASTSEGQIIRVKE